MPHPPAAPAPAPIPSVSESAQLRLGYAGRLRARERRWQARHFDRRAIGLLVLAALVANLLWIVALERVMLVTPPRVSRDAIIVSVIEPVEPLPIPDEPVPAVFARKPSSIAIAPPEAKLRPPPVNAPDSSTTTARIGTAGTPAPQLFRADGSLRLPEAKVRIGAERIDNPQEAAKARWAEIERRGENPLDCERTRFAGAFRPDMSAGDAVASKYLSWIGHADPEAIAERARQRSERAAAGCDPPPR